MKKLTSLFFEIAGGHKPVREWLLTLEKQDRKIIGQDIKTVEFGWPVGMPVCRHLEGKLYEVRGHISDKRIARVIFLVTGEYMILLNGFVKKTQKTPKSEIELARKRAKEIRWN